MRGWRNTKDMLALYLALALAPAAFAAQTPGVQLTGRLRAQLIAADVLVPTDLAKWEAAVAEWTEDPAWPAAKKAAEDVGALRRALTGSDPAALEEAVGVLTDALDVPQPGDDALAARYEALRAALLGAGVLLEPETERFRGADGAPLDADDWTRFRETLPPNVRRNLFTVFGAACGVGEKPPLDPLAYVAKKRKIEVPKAAPVVKAAPKKAAPPKPKPAAPVISKATPKEEAIARELKALRVALDAPALALRVAEPEKAELLKAWEKVLGSAVSEDATVDFPLAVNGLREITTTGSTTAARWGFVVAAAFNLGSDFGPKATLTAVLAKTGTTVSAGRLYAKAMELAGAARAPADGRTLSAAIKEGTALEAAAVDWAGTLPNPKKSNAFAGAVKTFKLESTVNKLRGMFGL